MKQRRWILWLVVIAFGLLVVRSFTDFRSLVATLVTGHWPWLLAAMIFHLLFYLPYAQLYRVAFTTVGVESRLGELLPLVFAAIFANAAVPSGGASAAALFIDDAVRRRQSGAAAAVGTLLVLIADLATLIPFLVYGMVALALRHVLKFYDIMGGAIFVIFVGGLCGGLLLAQWRPRWLVRLLIGAKRLINRSGSWLQRPDLLPPDWAERNAAEITAATEALRRDRRGLAALLTLGLILHLISLASLYTIFLAYDQLISLGPLTAGFAMGIVFWVIAIVPQGVGATEGIMTLVYTSLGVPRTKAITLALVFRGVNFLLPLIIGFYCLRHVRTFGIVKELEADAPI